mgnify:CR=1 FL=1
MLRLPSEDYLAELASQGDGANVDTIHRARDIVRAALGSALEPTLLARYQGLENREPYAPDGAQIAARSLRNICLSYLVAADPKNMSLAVTQYQAANNMTDRLAALREIAFYGDDSLRDSTLQGFKDGSGYRFLGDMIIALNKQNPQIAARLVTPLTKWRSYAGRGQLMRAELQRLAAEASLSPDVFEVVTKSLN